MVAVIEPLIVADEATNAPAKLILNGAEANIELPRNIPSVSLNFKILLPLPNIA